MGNFTSRERVLKTLNHEEPDRVPIDLGGSIATGIMANALDHLRKYLGLENRPVKVYEVFQMLGEVEMDLVERFKIDVLPVEPKIQCFGLKIENYKPWKMWDGTEVLMPGQFKTEEDPEGNLLLHSEGDPLKPIEGVMPKNGFYFDIPSLSKYEINYSPPSLDDIKKENHLTNEELEFMAEKAENLRSTTDKALFLDQGKIGLRAVGSVFNFLTLLYSNKNYVKDLFKIRTETALDNLEKLKKYLGQNIDIICLDVTDYGIQDREMFGPNIFEELFVPHLKVQNSWIHKNTNWKTFQHTCGSIPNLLPLLVETGLDILNPVQTSAKGMDPEWLKKNFGGKLTFWGGGVDTQKTLPFGNVEDIQKDVEERIKIFAPGGGFVFSSIHNIQHGVLPENIAAVFDTAYNFGKYPINL